MNPKRLRPFRTGPVFGAVLLVFAGLVSACDSSSNGGHGPADNFVGRWSLDPHSGFFSLSGCTNPDLIGDFSIWDSLEFDYGELSDLMEVSGTCGAFVESGQTSAFIPGLPYDVSGDVATATPTNPFSEKPLYCLTSLGTDSLGYSLGLRVTPKTESWQFALTAKAGGEPRRAEYGVKKDGDAAMAELVTPGEDGLVVLDTCSLTGRATFFRVTTN
jgi:hypothetical protein